MKTLLAFVALVAAAACRESAEPTPSVTGTWIGAYRNYGDPSWTVQATFSLQQAGTNVSGTMQTSAGRAANLQGIIEGTRLSGGLTFVDSCLGSATTTAELVGGRRLTGAYTIIDCRGSRSGTYELSRQ